MIPHLNCVDMSRWGGELTAAECEALKAAGVRCVIVGTGHEPANAWVGQQALAAATAGLLVECYIWIDLRNSEPYIASACRQALTAPWALFVRRWWVDCESPSDIAPALAERGIDAALSVLDNDPERRPVGLYTARWWWTRNKMGSKYSSRPLWSAHYDGDPDIDFGSAPYGGWTQPLIEQYQGTTVLGGQSVDLNYHGGLDMAQPTVPEAPPSSDLGELRARVAALEAFTERLNVAALARFARLAEAFDAFADGAIRASAAADSAADPAVVPEASE